MNRSVQDDQGLLARLHGQGVEFVIIGGFCGVMHGVSLVTRDLDVCCDFTPANLHRLEAALRGLHPVHRLAGSRLPFELTDELCGRLPNLYLQTDIGRLDCLSEVKGVGDFAAVLKRSVACQLSHGEFRMLDLDALIAAKEAMGRDHDLAAVRQLRGIQERLAGGGPQTSG